jgi:nitric oxide reductase NorD protein
VWLPRRIACFDDASRNLLLYKLAAAVQCGHIALDTYRASLPPEHPLLIGLERRYGRAWAGGAVWLEDFFGLFPDPELAGRLYQAAATVRVASDVAARLPGLWREVSAVVVDLFAARPAAATLAPREGFFEAIRRSTWLGGDAGSAAGLPAAALLEPLRLAGTGPSAALPTVGGLYRLAATLSGGAPAVPLPFDGQLRPGAAEERRLARRAAARERFIEAVRTMLAERSFAAAEPETSADEGRSRPTAAAGATDGAALGRPDAAGEGGDDAAHPDFIRIGARTIEIPPGLRPLVDEIRRDLGRVPDVYVSGAIAAAGNAAVTFRGPAVPDGPSAEEFFVYDEWDFRRAGFRKGWCSLRELELPAGDPAAVARIVRAYRGPLQRIRRAFELMRTSERFVRRQRDGDEVDIDAVIEARSDLVAGRPASDRLFIRLVRDARDIAAVFLVDMSSSTEGWVNTAIRESLVLLCEGLETLGDRYAVFGFSGMKRLGSQLFRVKLIDEPYGPAVKGRIAAIAPRDYTRMGPPIRHATRLLGASDAKVRLLVMLSDGRPEDYDEYKGDYAVEDTRHALIEAQSAGVHPFCITVDREAREYAAHLFGAVNYVVIDDPAKLPLRIPEIYRALTS